jgi:hypothetical protein
MQFALDRVTAALVSEEMNRPPLPAPVVKVPRPRRPRGYRSLEAGIPLLGLGDVARAVQPDGTLIPPEPVRLVTAGRPVRPGGFAVRVIGGSLSGGYEDGDAAVCEPGRPADGQVGLLVLRNRECLPATWRTDSTGRLQVTPLDTDLPRRTVPVKDVIATFAVVARMPRSEAQGGEA